MINTWCTIYMHSEIDGETSWWAYVIQHRHVDQCIKDAVKKGTVYTIMIEPEMYKSRQHAEKVLFEKHPWAINQAVDSYLKAV